MFDALEIKWTGDNFCRNLVIFHVIIFNLTCIVPHLLLAISSVRYCFIQYCLVLARTEKSSYARVKMNYAEFFRADKLKNINSFFWIFYRYLTAVNIWKAVFILSS